jgi:hypothetical protein
MAPIQELVNRFEKLYHTCKPLQSELALAQLENGIQNGHIRVLHGWQETRWHCIYRMIDSYLAVVPYIEKLRQSGVLIIADSDFNRNDQLHCKPILDVLEKVMIASRRLEARNVCTIHRVLRVLTKLSNELVHVQLACGSSMAKDLAANLLKAIAVRFSNIKRASWITLGAALSPIAANIQDDFIALNNSLSLDAPTGDDVLLDALVAKLVKELESYIGSENPPAQAQNVLNQNELGVQFVPEIAMHNSARDWRENAKIAARNALRLLRCIAVFQANKENDELQRRLLNGEDDIGLFWLAVERGDEQFLAQFTHNPVPSLGEPATSGMTVLQNFLKLFKPVIKGVLAIQASSAAAESVFSEADRQAKLGVRNIETIAERLKIIYHFRNAKRVNGEEVAYTDWHKEIYRIAKWTLTQNDRTSSDNEDQ